MSFLRYIFVSLVLQLFKHLSYAVSLLTSKKKHLDLSQTGLFTSPLYCSVLCLQFTCLCSEFNNPLTLMCRTMNIEFHLKHFGVVPLLSCSMLMKSIGDERGLHPLDGRNQSKYQIIGISK